MKNNNNKLFGGMGPEKAGELGGSAHHKCRGRECDEKAHATHSKDHNQDKSKSTTAHKTGNESAKPGHVAPKADHKTNSHKKD